MYDGSGLVITVNTFLRTFGLSSELDHFEYRGSTYIFIVDGFPNPEVGHLLFSPHREFRIFNVQQKICGAGLGTQSERAPGSERAETRRRVDGPDVSRIIIQHHSINMTLPNDVPESLEYHFDVKTLLLFLFQTGTSQEPPNGFQ